MIVKYGFSIIGKSHIERGTDCQDSHAIKELDNGWIIAAIADGVGSAKNSGIGSHIAVESVVNFCEKYFPWNGSLLSIKSMLRTSYNYAFNQIICESQKSQESIESYDTTLTTVVYDGSRIVYAHSGDGGIIGLNTFGDYIPITKPLKGKDGVSVIPLRFGDSKWIIESYEEDLAAVLLVTDGMLDIITPYLLRNNKDNISGIYVPLASFFMEPRGFINSADLKNIIQSIKDFVNSQENYNPLEFYSRLRSIYFAVLDDKADDVIENITNTNVPITLMESVRDDKTVVALINNSLQTDIKQLEYYSEPDWQQKQEAWNRIAYPHLYVHEHSSKEISTTKNQESKESIQDNCEEKSEPSLETGEPIEYNGIKNTIKSIKKLFNN